MGPAGDGDKGGGASAEGGGFLTAAETGGKRKRGGVGTREWRVSQVEVLDLT